MSKGKNIVDVWNITPNRWNSRFNIVDKEYLTCECIVEIYRHETGNKTLQFENFGIYEFIEFKVTQIKLFDNAW